MSNYMKINTLYMRNEKGIIIPNEYSMSEFEFLKNCKWVAEEKIDGTCIAVFIRFTEDDVEIEFQGKEKKSIIPQPLKKVLEMYFKSIDNREYQDIFPNALPGDVITIFGEGYGKGIQDPIGKSYLPEENDFIVFDVKFNNYWLNRKAVEEIANRLRISVVPFVGFMTIPEAEDYVIKGFKSNINSNVQAEGLVLKTPTNIQTKTGGRIVVKVKTRDYIKYKRSIE